MLNFEVWTTCLIAQIYNICHWSLIFAHDPISQVLYLYLDLFCNAITLLYYIEYLVLRRLFLKSNGSNGDSSLQIVQTFGFQELDFSR